jgi:hypothetical protein
MHAAPPESYRIVANRPARRCDTRFPCRGATCCARTACIAIYLTHNCLCGLFAVGLSPGATGCAPTKVSAYRIVAWVKNRGAHRRHDRHGYVGATSPTLIDTRLTRAPLSLRKLRHSRVNDSAGSPSQKSTGVGLRVSHRRRAQYAYRHAQTDPHVDVIRAYRHAQTDPHVDVIRGFPVGAQPVAPARLASLFI